MFVAFRADSSSRIGTGHIYRCMALAEALKERGAEVAFISRDAPGHIAGLVRQRGWRILLIPDDARQAPDAAATIAALAGRRPDWLVVDHYGLDAAWQALLRPQAGRLMAIDDLADRPHAVDVLLDASSTPEQLRRYAALAGPGTERLFGLDYILLRRIFRDRPPPLRDHAQLTRILVTFGGNDPIGLSGRFLGLLEQGRWPGLQFDLTLGRSNPQLAALCERAQRLANVAVHVDTPHMPELMAGAGLCLGAGGTTAFERCYMGLPSLAVALADNQLAFAPYGEALGFARYLGDARVLTPQGIAAGLDAAIADAAWRASASAAGMRLVDGLGAVRVAARMLADR